MTSGYKFLMDHAAVLFGSRANDALLLNIAQQGRLRKTSSLHVSSALLRSGLIAEILAERERFIVLDSRHPSYWKIVDTLSDIGGRRPASTAWGQRRGAEHWIDGSRPLGHSNALAFRILHVLASAERLSCEDLNARLAPIYPKTIRSALDSLERHGLIVCSGSAVHLSRQLPASYLELVREVGAIVVKRDPRLTLQGVVAVPRVVGFSAAVDGAPMLFGTDIRLRNLLALAKHGPMLLSDLRCFSGSRAAHTENADKAPFGRGNLVLVWHCADGVAATLHPGHPLRIPLRSLLLKLEQQYPLPSYAIRHRPVVQCKVPWAGDKRASLGGEIATTILFSIGVYGWTFEALCVSLCTGYDRGVVKKSLKKLEACGVLESERARRPGFDVRVVRISNSFVAARELRTLVEAACEVWPSFAARVHNAFSQLAPRTRQYLRKRGLLPQDTPQTKPWELQNQTERRRECLRRYYDLTSQLMRDAPSYEVMKRDSNLYRRIRACWGSFEAFRRDAGLPPTLTRAKSRPSSTLRDWCINRYVGLISECGFQPNTNDLMKLDTCLYECIRVQWGGFAAFCDDLKFSPARRKHRAALSDDEKREECCAEYRDLMKRLGRHPTAREINWHNIGLRKRIVRLWGSLSSFRAHITERSFEPPRPLPEH